MPCVSVSITHQSQAPQVSVAASAAGVVVDHASEAPALDAQHLSAPSQVAVAGQGGGVAVTAHESPAVTIEEVCFHRFNDQDTPPSFAAVCYYCYADGADQGGLSNHEFTELLEQEAAALSDANLIAAAKDGDIRGETITFVFSEPCLWILTPAAMTAFTSARDVNTDFTFALEPAVDCTIHGIPYKARRSNAMDIGTTYTVRFA